MKPTLILSMRHSLIDPRPAKQLLDMIVHIKNEAAFRGIPITICYQTDPNDFTLDRANDNNAINQKKEKIDHKRSNFNTGQSSAEEHAFDLSEFRLLQSVRLLQEAHPLSTQVIASDLPGTARTTGEHLAAWQARIKSQNAERENAMAAALINTNNIEKGGIILDYGDFFHLAAIKQILVNNPLLNDKKPKPDVCFFGVVPEETATSLKDTLTTFAQKFKLMAAEDVLTTSSTASSAAITSNSADNFDPVVSMTTIFDATLNTADTNNNGSAANSTDLEKIVSSIQ